MAQSCLRRAKVSRIQSRAFLVFFSWPCSFVLASRYGYLSEFKKPLPTRPGPESTFTAPAIGRIGAWLDAGQLLLPAIRGLFVPMVQGRFREEHEDGACRQSPQVRRLRQRFRLYRRGATLFPSAAVSQRPKAVQAMQGEADHRGAKLRPETRTTCSNCGAQTTVPFLPTQGRPVLCRDCFQTNEAVSRVAGS